MAEMALGMTKTVVEGAVNRIQAALEEEQKLKDGVQQDLMFITAEFQMMQSFLRVANKERAKKNEVVRTFVRQLRDLAFDVDNWVELVAHLDPQESTAWSGLWRVVPSWAVPHCLAPPRHLDEAAAEMKMLKARVEEVSCRNNRYNIFSTGDGSPPDSGCGLDSKKATAAANINPSHRAFEILRQMWVNEVGRLREVDEDSPPGCLKKLLVAPDAVFDADLQAIWLWGGKDRHLSRLINQIYHDPETRNCFHHRAWVKITRPFKQEEFLETLQDQLVLTNSTGLITRYWSMQQRKYLVVVENVSDLVEWNTIRMCLQPHMSNKSSRIVVSTQHLFLPIDYTGRTYLVSELAWYPDGRPSICAFYKKVVERCCDTDDVAQIGQKIKAGSVISVCGDGERKSRLVKLLYKRWGAEQKGKKWSGGVKFWQRWVPMVVGDQQALNRLDLLRRMLLPMHQYGFYDGDLRELLNMFSGCQFIGSVLGMREEDLIQEICEHLNNNYSLVVIHDLRSKDDWDVIKSIFLLPKIPRCCCFIVVTSDPFVASYCVGGNEERLVSVRADNADMAMCQGRISPYKCEDAIVSMRSIYDRHYQESNKRQEHYDKLIRICIGINADTLRVMSVFGMAGVGKSTLVKWFYSKKLLDPENVGFNVKNYCWVEVPHPFSLEELSWRLLLELLSEDAGRMESAMTNIIVQGGDIIQECQMRLRILHEAGTLIVLDGVRSTEDWDAVNVAFCLSQAIYWNYTIVITDKMSVAMHCVNNNARKLVSVRCLEHGDALHLFRRQIDYGNMDASEGKDDGRVLELSERIMARCGGLPKVVAAVAECYKKSRENGMYFKLKDIDDNYMHILERSGGLDGLFSWMQSYLETCKDDIKPCIFYLPVFLGQNVRYRRLVQRWAAEGYVRDTPSDIAEKNGQRLLLELLKFSMVHLQRSSKPVQFQVNGFFHEYIISRPMEDNLCLALEGPCSLNASQRAGPPAQHLTVTNISDKDEAAFRSLDFSKLRSVTVIGKCKPFMFEIKMRYVRVLDLEDATGVENDHLEQVVVVFPRLKFLSLRGCREITSLPKSLGRLKQLQTLDVRDTSIATLPVAILELHKLQYVRGGTRHSNPWNEGGSMVEMQPTALEEEDPTTTVAADTSAPAEDSTTAAVEAVEVAAAPPLAAQRPTTFVEAPLSKADDTKVSPAPAQDSSQATSSSRPHALMIPSWLSKLCCRSRTDNPGVDVPARIGKLKTLQTFGVANVGTGRKAVIIKELPKLTELRRLAVCGVNPDSVHLFFSAVTGLPHLKWLSVRLDKSNKDDGRFACLDDTVERPPKSLNECLKLQGHVRVLASSWVKEFATVKHLDLEVTLQREQDMQVILDQLLHHNGGWGKSCLCLKPFYDGSLSVGMIDDEGRPRPIELHFSIVEIVCTTKLEVTIVGNMPYVGVVKVRCSSGSSLQLSGLQQIRYLREVWLKGSFSDDSLKQNLQRQLADHPNKPVLMKAFQPSTN